MSVTLAFLTSVPQVIVMAAGESITDQITTLFADVKDVVLIGGSLAAMVFFITKVAAARGSMVSILGGLLAAGLFTWGIYNVTTVKDGVNEQINKGAPVISQVDHATPDSPTVPV